MSMNRRKFFAFLGAAPAIALVGAKALAENQPVLSQGYVGDCSGISITDPCYQHTIVTYEMPEHTHSLNWTREDLANYGRPQYAAIVRRGDHR